MTIRPASVLHVLVAGSALLSCADIASPTRSEAYEWRLLMPTGTGDGVDTLSFHWPRSRLPVRIWVEDSLSLPSHVRQGIEQWEAAFLYREFSAVLVSDSNAADVMVQSGIAPKAGFSITRLGGFLAPECEGATDIELPPGSRQIQPPLRVYVEPRFDPSTPGVDECMALTTAHELGHALGIFAHSPNTADLMYADPTASALTTRDRATAEVAYHTEPTLTVGSR
ncbi:MAG: hypothetical protein ACREMZ_12090 [Gemmatimonadales bacterium]